MSAEEEEIASRTSKYIINLNLLMKQITIESKVSDILDSYLAYLRSSQIYLSNGIFKTNFSEGALVLQAAAQIYSKKIDLLWDCVIQYHERITSYEEKTEKNAGELQKIEERKTRFKRKKKVPEVQQAEEEEKISPMQMVLNEISGIEFGEIHDYEKLLECSDDQFESEQLDINYFDKWNNYFSRMPRKKHDTISPILYTNIREEMTPAPSKFILKIPRSKLKTSVYELGFFDEYETLCKYSITSIAYIIQYDLASMEYQYNTLNIPLDKLRTTIPSEHIYKIISRLPKVPHQDEKDLAKIFHEKYVRYMKSIYNLSPSLQYLRRKLCPQSLTVSIEVLPEEVLTKYLAKANAHKDIGNPLRKTIDSHSDVDSGFFDHSDFDNAHEGDNLNTSLTPIMEDGENEDINLKKHDADVDSGVEETTIEEENKVKQRRKRRNLESIDEFTPRKRKTKIKLLPTITVKLRIYEKFFYENYHTEEGEGQLIEPIYESEPESDDCQGETDPLMGSEVLNNSHVEDKEESTNIEDTSVSEEPEMSDVEKAAQLAEEAAKKYLDWKDFIYKTIKKDMLVDYDIHEEGSNILNSIPENGVLKFSNFSSGKSSGQISRSFVAMLQLANTNNIELQNTNPGGLANDTLELKLLSKERHHEKLLNYSAPSEMVFAEKMQRARAEKHNLPSTSGIVKRLKIG